MEEITEGKKGVDSTIRRRGTQTFKKGKRKEFFREMLITTLPEYGLYGKREKIESSEKDFASARKSDKEHQAYIPAPRQASSVVAKTKAATRRKTCSSLSLKSSQFPPAICSWFCFSFLLLS